ncbi:M1 family metallopeptidase [Formosa sp. A9]|uniref:M1 family metallopeptidase n=1 Tax=Formosa sp. A9 TaxID=3442641 RepID=UPI003EB933E1
MKPFLLLVLVLCLSSCNQNRKNATELTLVKGVSEQMAVVRKAQISDLVYDLKFDIPKTLSDSISASETIYCTINDKNAPLIIDFKEATHKLLSISVNNQPIDIEHTNGHIVINQNDYKIGENSIEIAFIAGELSLNRNEDYLYTLLVPDRASTFFPCFDQPDLKAEYNLKITAPNVWKVMAGAPLQQVETKGDVTEHWFETSDKMSTYLFSFVVGDFKLVEDEVDGLKMRMLYRETDEDKIQASVPEIFRLHREAITFLEHYTGCAFPFKKIDFAAIPGFQYGGMEHVGAIQYRESTLFLDETATESQRLRRGKLIAHETAHMWFGDLVTMKWFNDVWLKEVFANFMADKIANPSFPDINHKLQFMLTHYPSAYGVDRTAGSNPIRQHLDNLNNAGTLYGNIIYNKAPIMMRQLEALIGEEAFKKGIQTYIKTFANENADWNDLIEILDAQTAVDVKTWSDNWVNTPGRAVFSEDMYYDENDELTNFKLSQKAEAGTEDLWAQSFDIGLVYPDSVRVVNVSVSDADNQLDGLIGTLKPQEVFYNYNGFGYGVFPPPRVLAHILELKDDVAKGYAYINVYENILLGTIAPLQGLKLFKTAVQIENNEAIIRLVSSQIRNLFWGYLTPGERTIEVEHLEKELRQRLKQDLPSGVKKTLFGLYEDIAYNQEGKAFLYRIWSKKQKLDNLKLNENDYVNLAAKLAIYEHEQVTDILAQTKAQITNPDRLLRFEYLQPSLSYQVAERDLFFESLNQEKYRVKEQWVLDGLSYLNHPLRQKYSQKYIKPSLELLEEVQLTGDIFFPIGWLQSTVGLYNSEYAMQVVDEFLNEHPDFSKVLELKILQASDQIHRAQRLFKLNEQ